MPLSLSLFLILVAFSAFLAISIQQNHLLMVLLFFELMILSLMMTIITSCNMSIMYFILMILTLGACEASIGLALLASITRYYGADYLNMLTINKC